MKNKDVVRDFLNGNASKTTNVRSTGDKLINYKTVLAQKINGQIVVNSTYYSNTTSRVQHHIRTELHGLNYVEVDNVPQGTSDLEEWT